MSTTVVEPLRSRPLSPHFGVEILGLNLSGGAHESMAAFDDVCRRHSLVLVRDQVLSPSELIALSERFGKVSPQPVGPHPEFPAITILSNKKIDGRPIGVHEAGRGWHTDGSTYSTPGLTTILHALEVPAEGGDTLFADAKAAFDSLPAERRKDLEAIRVVHNRATLFDETNSYAPTNEERSAWKDVVHPLVIDSPIGGGKTFFITRASVKAVVGTAGGEGLALIDELIEYITQEQFVYRHKWRAGDVVIWNDLCTMHTATAFDAERYSRLVYRTWIRPAEAS